MIQMNQALDLLEKILIWKLQRKICLNANKIIKFRILKIRKKINL